jgi:hypothetical protein
MNGCSEEESVESIHNIKALQDLNEIFLFDHPKPEGEGRWQ